MGYLLALRTKLALVDQFGVTMPSAAATTGAAAAGGGFLRNMSRGGKAGLIGMIGLSVLPPILNAITGNSQAQQQGRMAAQQQLQPSMPPAPMAPTMAPPMMAQSMRLPNMQIG